MMRKMVTAALALIGGVALWGESALAELKGPVGFPNREFNLIVPWGAGGGSDQVSRAWAKAMEEVTGWPVKVENKPGNVGMGAVPDFMNAPKDGYTLFQSVDIAVANHAAGKLPQNPAVDWDPVCITQLTFSQIYVRPDETRFTDWASFVDYAKAHPGEIKVANVGNPTAMEGLSMRALEEEFGFSTQLVAYDKAAERYASLIGGMVDILFEQPGDVVNFLDAGQMKPILTLYEDRPAAFSEVPTHLEAGAKFDALLRFRGFFIHPDVDSARKEYLQAACRAAFDTENYQSFNKAKYMDLIDSFRAGEQARKLIATSVETYKKLLAE